MKRTSCEKGDAGIVDRRRFLGTLVCTCALSTAPSALSMQLVPSLSESLTKEQRDSMTPAQVIDELKKGNERFRTQKMASRNYLVEKRSSAAGQYPAAALLL